MTLKPWWNSSQINNDVYIDLDGLAGEIWIAIPTVSSDTSNQTEMEFINCQLYNSSLTVNIEFINQVSNITVIENKWMNDLYRNDLETATASGLLYGTEFYSYFAYLQEIGIYLLGAVWSFEYINILYEYRYTRRRFVFGFCPGEYLYTESIY
jgi:hypothetical protein